MQRLYLMRHAEAQLAEHQRGDADADTHLFSVGDEPLSAAGREQASRTAKLFAHVHVDAVYASPLARCQETAALIAAPLGLEVETVDELAEVPFGEPGMGYEAVLERIVRLAIELKEGEDPELAGGRRYSEVKQRFADAIDAILDAHEAPIVVAHGATNRVWLAELLGMAPHRLFRLEQDHCCVNVIAYERHRPVVQKVNATVDPLWTEGASFAGE